MTSYSMADLERLAIGQGRGDETTQDHSGVNTSYHPPRTERSINRKIYDYLFSEADWRSRAEIAKALGLKKTGWLIEHIEQLVTDGYLVKEKTERTNGMNHFWYAVGR